MSATVLALFLIAVSYLQMKKLYQKKQMQELYVYGALMLIAAYLSIGSLLDFYIPNPTNGIIHIFQPVQEWIDKLLS